MNIIGVFFGPMHARAWCTYRPTDFSTTFFLTGGMLTYGPPQGDPVQSGEDTGAEAVAQGGFRLTAKNLFHLFNLAPLCLIF